MLAACTPDNPTTWCPPAHEGSEVVRSSGPGRWERAGESAQLVELWRAGGTRAGEELAFPVAMAASRGGRVAITDFRLGEVAVVDRDGTWLGPWGRRGSGPGELTTPVAASWDRDERLVVFDIAAPKVLFFDDGVPARPDESVDPSFTAPVILSGEIQWAGVQPTGGVLLQPAPRPAPDQTDPALRTSVVQWLAPGAQVADTLAQMTVRTVPHGAWGGWPIPGWPRLLVAVGNDGALAVNRDAAYRIAVHDSLGRIVRTLCRDAPARPLTESELRDASGLAPELVAALRRAPAPTRPAAVGRLFFGADGRLWVQRDLPIDDVDLLLGRAGALHDVFDVDGAYLGEVRAPPRVRLQTVAGEMVYALEFGEYDEAWVVAYRLVYN